MHGDFIVIEHVGDVPPSREFRLTAAAARADFQRMKSGCLASQLQIEYRRQ